VVLIGPLAVESLSDEIGSEIQRRNVAG